MPQFNRTASVEIGKRGETGIRLEGFRITFQVKKTKVSTTNEATVKIYNLSEATRTSITKEQVMILRAGYVDDVGERVVFIGDITEVNHNIARPDVVTTIISNDGEEYLRNSAVSVSYETGVSLKKVLEDIAKKTGVTLKNTIAKVTDKKLSQGFSFSGKVRTLVDKITRSLEAEWSIQNDELKIQDTDLTDESKIILLTSNTGLIGSPERLKVRVRKKKKNDTGMVDGWSVKALLIPGAEPGGVVAVTSREIPAGSEFKIVDVTHNGDTHTGPWDSTIEVMELKNG